MEALNVNMLLKREQALRLETASLKKFCFNYEYRRETKFRRNK